MTKFIRKYISILLPLCIANITVLMWMNNHRVSRFVTTLIRSPDSDITCPNITLSHTPLPLTVLVSFPGSGNTWTRYLLERMTGIATGSDYFDESLERGGFIGESKLDDSVIAVKTHAEYSPENSVPLSDIQRAILVIRNPYQALLADFNRHHSKSHVGTVSLSVFMKEWPNYYSQWSIIWYRVNESWITKMKHLCVIFYENLQSDLRTELTRLYSFLDLSDHHDNVQCATREPEGHFHRNTTNNLPLQFFYDMDQVNFINSEIDKLEVLLSKYNYSFYNVSDYKQPGQFSNNLEPTQN